MFKCVMYMFVRGSDGHAFGTCPAEFPFQPKYGDLLNLGGLRPVSDRFSPPDEQHRIECVTYAPHENIFHIGFDDDMEDESMPLDQLLKLLAPDWTWKRFD